LSGGKKEHISTKKFQEKIWPKNYLGQHLATDLDPDAEPDPVQLSVTHPDPVSHLDLDAEPEVEPDPDAEPDSDAEPEVELDPDAEPDWDAELEVEPDPVPHPDPDQDPLPDSDLNNFSTKFF
jgi:hypothetical protein